MAITIATTLLSNQSILENIALVEEIGEQTAEIISGGQSVNITPVNEDEPDPIISKPKLNPDINPQPNPNPPLSVVDQANFVFV